MESSDNSTVKNRLRAFIKYKGLGQGKFESICGLSNGYVNNIRKSIQPDKIQRIVHQFPELNAGWLLTGEGNMLKDIGGTNVSINNSGSMTHNNVGNAGNNIINVSVPESGMQKIINPDGTVKIQSAGYAEGRIKHLEKMLEEKDKTIAALKSALISKEELIETLKQLLKNK